MQGNIGQLGKISIHAPHEGERPDGDLTVREVGRISIHAPHEGERRAQLLLYRGRGVGFQSTLPTRGSDKRFCEDWAALLLFQSTLPTRGSDGHRGHERGACSRISIHAPHEGERLNKVVDELTKKQFQSTLPTRGSDLCIKCFLASPQYFNPRSPRGGATLAIVQQACGVDISIHAPHEGERRAMQPLSANARRISIHAPHEGERQAPCA